MSHGLVPIQIRDYVRLHLKSNPGTNGRDLTERLQSTLAAHKAGARCACGGPIWVLGSAEVGHMCFTCITGEADPSENYEIAEACDKGRPRRGPKQKAAQRTATKATAFRG